MSWRGSDELTFGESLIGVFGILVVLAIMVLLSGCASIEKRVAPVCAQVDRVGPALTLVAKADEDLIEAESRAECLLCRAGTDAAVCCTAAIDRAIAKHSKLRAALSDVAAVSDAVVRTSHEAGVCK